MSQNYPPCIACNSSQRKIISNHGRNFTKLTTVICAGCGLIHSLPIPSQSELDKFYKDEYRKKYKSSFRPQKRHTARYARGCFDIVNEIIHYLNEDVIDNKTFLDIGSGSGEVLFFAKKMGFEVLGIEPNMGYAKFSKDELHLNVVNSTLEKTKFENKKFDVIHLNQVLEHMPDPLDALARLENLLNQNGLLVITVPDIEANLHSPMTRFHYAHVYNYNHLNLKKIIDKSGLQILNPETKSTKIYAKKVLNHDNTKIDFDFSVNYKKIFHLLSKNNSNNHYFTTIPYKRFFKKCYEYPREILISLFSTNHLDILDRVYRKYKNK